MSKSTRAPKNVKSTNDETGAPLAPVVAPVVVIDAPPTNAGAALAALDAIKIDAPPTEGAPSSQAYTLAVSGAGADVLGGRIGARTHDIHVVLCDAAQSGAILTTRVIETRATALSSAQGRPPCKATASHLNTMKARAYVERVNGAWRLTNAARELVKLAPLS